MNVGKKKQENKQEREYLEVRIVEVSNVKVVDAQNGATLIFLTLNLNGVSINNCRIATTKDGRDFVAFPSYKGSNGQYYSYVYAPLSEEDTAAICELVQKEIDKQ